MSESIEESIESTNECIVCLEPIHQSMLPCQHFVHTRCIALSGQSTCSVCRREITFTDAEDQAIYEQKVQENEQEVARQNLRASERLARLIGGGSARQLINLAELADLSNQEMREMRQFRDNVWNHLENNGNVRVIRNVNELREAFQQQQNGANVEIVQVDDDVEDENQDEDMQEEQPQMYERELTGRTARRLIPPTFFIEPFQDVYVSRREDTAQFQVTINELTYHVQLDNVDQQFQTMGGVVDFGDMIQQLNQICINVNSSQYRFSTDLRALQLYRVMCILNHLSAQTNLSVVELCNIISTLQ